MMIAAATARHPYSTTITHTGSVPHVPLTLLKCHIRYVGMMLTVHTIISQVDADVRNGNSHNKYQGNTTGAHNRDAAMGHANASIDMDSPRESSVAFLLRNSVPSVVKDCLRIHVAVASPASNASSANNCEGIT